MTDLNLEIFPAEPETKENKEEPFRIVIRGTADRENAGYLHDTLLELGKEHGRLAADCSKLVMITTAAAQKLAELKKQGCGLTMDHLNQDCYAALYIEGLECLAGSHMEIPVYEKERYEILGEGSNGVVYRVDDMTLKVFKKTPDFDAILKERRIMKLAMAAGLDCPISMGFALVDGKIALRSEMAAATSLTKLYRKDPAKIDETIDAYVAEVKKFHAIQGEPLAPFPQKAFLKSILEKTVRMEEQMPERYAGKIGQLIKNIGEPDVLLHGDPQPSNVRYGENGLSFIDMETLSTGPAVLDLAALRRTLLDADPVKKQEENPFLKLPQETCNQLWEKFFRCYYAGQSEEYLAQKEMETAVIANVLMAHNCEKRGGTETARLFLKETEKLLDEASGTVLP